MVVVSRVFCHTDRCLGSNGWREDGSSRCGLPPLNSYSYRAEVGARNPVRCQLDEVVVDGLDNDRHWMRQCKAELEG